MRVGFATHPRIGLNKGGLQVQIASTRSALEHVGLVVDLWDPWTSRPTDFDIVHGFTVDPSLLPIARACAHASVPFVLSTVYNASGRSVWGDSIRNQLTSLLPVVGTDRQRSIELVRTATSILALHDAEADLLRRSFGASPDVISVVSNGISTDMAHDAARPPRAAIPGDGYVLHVGHFWPNKNQHLLIDAIGGLHELVLFGSAPAGHPEYRDMCIERSGPHVHFMEGGQKDVAPAYAHAGALVLCSSAEVQPLTLMEAASTGCPLVVADHLEVPAFLEPVVRFRLGSAAAMQRAVALALAMGRSPRNVPTWDYVASRIAEVYVRAINSNG